MKKRTKIILIVLAVLLLLPVLFWTPIKRKGVAWLKEKASETVQRETNGRYQLEIGRVGVVLPTATVRLNDIRFTRDTSVQDSSGIDFLDRFDVDFSLDRLVVRGINWRAYLSDKDIDISRIGFIGPDLTLRERSAKDNTSSSSPERDSARADSSANQAPNIRIGGTYVESGEFQWWEYGHDEPLLRVNGLAVDLDELLRKSGEEPTIPYASLEASLDEAEFLVGQYTSSLRSSGLSVENGNLHMDSLYYGARISPAQLNVKFGFLKSWIQTTLYDLNLSDFDLNTLFTANRYEFGTLNVPRADFHLIRDRQTYEPPPTYKALPVELVHDIGFPVALDSLVVDNADIRVEILSPKANLAGLLTFTNSSLLLKNLTNQDARIAENPQMTVHATGLVVGESKVNLDLAFQLDKPETGNFSTRASFAPIALPKLNIFFEREVLMRIAEGSLERLAFQFNATNTHANGTLDFEYRDLKFSKLSPHREFLKDKPKSGLVVFAANLVIPKNRTRERRRYRQGTIDVDRRLDRDLTDFLVTAMADGVLSSWGLDNVVNPKDKD